MTEISLSITSAMHL